MPRRIDIGNVARSKPGSSQRVKNHWVDIIYGAVQDSELDVDMNALREKLTKFFSDEQEVSRGRQ